MRYHPISVVVVCLLTLTSGANLAGQGSDECRRYPLLFENDHYRGRSLRLDQSVPDLHIGFMGDEASSLCVPRGWRVILFEDTGFGGDALELAGPEWIADLKTDRPGGEDWGDRISSVRVFQPEPDFGWRSGRLPRGCEDFPVLYDDDDFGGRSLRIDRSLHSLHDRGFGDQASSVCVPRGWRLILFEDTDFRGASLDLVGPEVIADLRRDQPGGRDWGDRTSSVQLLRTGSRSDRVEFPATDVPCDRYPMLYGDDDFRGRSIRLDSSVRDLHDRGFGDDASSLCVPRGWRVVLYEDTNYRGEALVLEGETAVRDLKRERPGGRDWGDRISSAEVSYREDWRRRGGTGRGGDPLPCDRYPLLYGDDNFRGRSFRIDRSIRDLHDRGFGDDASSVCVPPGWRITLYEDTDFRGNSLELRGGDAISDLKRDQPRGQDWGDRVSSVRVTRDRR